MQPIPPWYNIPLHTHTPWPWPWLNTTHTGPLVLPKIEEWATPEKWTVCFLTNIDARASCLSISRHTFSINVQSDLCKKCCTTSSTPEPLCTYRVCTAQHLPVHSLVYSTQSNLCQSLPLSFLKHHPHSKHTTLFHFLTAMYPVLPAACSMINWRTHAHTHTHLYVLEFNNDFLIHHQPIVCRLVSEDGSNQSLLTKHKPICTLNGMNHPDQVST